MNENQIKRKVFVPFLKTLYKGAFIYLPHDNYTAGIPDVIMLHHAKLYAYELKMLRKNNVPRHQQLTILKLISMAGGNAFVVYLSKNFITDDKMPMLEYNSIIKDRQQFKIKRYFALFLSLYKNKKI